jgi:hypothetical protein
VPEVFIGDRDEQQRGAYDTRFSESNAGFSCCSLRIVLTPVGDIQIMQSSDKPTH